MAILLPQMGGGKKIKDATALPEHVANGKVFYNNDGRQVGNGNFLEEKTIQLTARRHLSSSSSNVVEYITKDGITYDVNSGRYATNGDSINLQDAKCIIGINVEGVYIPFTRSLNYSRNYLIDMDTHKLLLVVENSDGNVNISYCDFSHTYDFILHYI